MDAKKVGGGYEYMMYIFSAIACLLCFSLMPLLIAICKKFSLYDEVDPRKLHSGNVPRLGGLVLFISFAIVFSLYSIFFAPDKMLEFWPLYIAFGIIFIGGILDDFFNLPAKLKLIIQIVVALIVALSPYNYASLFMWKMPLVVAKIFTFFWVLLLLNAYNLIDGMDWICSGLSIFTILTISLILVFEGITFASVGIILCGAILGFMIWNKPPAKIFLGDGGSQTLGFMIAVLPVVSNKNADVDFVKVLGVVLLSSIPITDVLAAVWRRLREHRRIFSSDRAHIHHKLLNVGFSQNAAIFLILLLQFFVCLSVLIAYISERNIGCLIMLLMFAVIESVFITFHYLNRSVNIRNKGKLESNPQEEHRFGDRNKSKDDK